MCQITHIVERQAEHLPETYDTYGMGIACYIASSQHMEARNVSAADVLFAFGRAEILLLRLKFLDRPVRANQDGFKLAIHEIARLTEDKHVVLTDDGLNI